MISPRTRKDVVDSYIIVEFSSDFQEETSLEQTHPKGS